MNLQLIGCGILQKEIRLLIAKNHWTIDTDFLPSSLHIDFKQLANALQQGLARHTNEQTIVFYGECHPRMEAMLTEAQTLRTQGQNCVAMLLGEDEFNRELMNGAFFLLEDWVLRWDKVMLKTFGTNIDIIRDIFHDQHRYLLALRTPCSEDYSADAMRISEMLALPLQWRDVDLDRLECTLQDAIQRKAQVHHAQ